jgi:hypothetical protein
MRPDARLEVLGEEHHAAGAPEATGEPQDLGLELHPEPIHGVGIGTAETVDGL